MVYDKDGQRIIYHHDPSVPQPSEVGNVAQSGYLGTSTAYSIQNGKIITSLAGTPFEVAVYKMGDSYIAARNNEFGYANYEVLPKGPINLVNLNKGEPKKEENEPPPGGAN